jgi:peptidoglycan hydrolase-like protein with peptidoglycan-binding domain
MIPVKNGMRSPLVGEVRRKLHLTIPAGPAAWTLDDDVEKALRAFQEERALPVTGELDDATFTALRSP